MTATQGLSYKDSRVSSHGCRRPGSGDCNLAVCGLHSLGRSLVKEPSSFQVSCPPHDWVPSSSEVHLLLLAAHPSPLPSSSPPNNLLPDPSAQEPGMRGSHCLPCSVGWDVAWLVVFVQHAHTEPWVPSPVLHRSCVISRRVWTRTTSRHGLFVSRF